MQFRLAPTQQKISNARLKNPKPELAELFFLAACSKGGGTAKTFFSAEYLSVVEITNKSSKKSLMILRLLLLMMSRVLALRASVEN